MFKVLFSFFALFMVSIKAGLTAQQKVQILSVFNQARSTTLVPASNMRQVVWDDAIAAEMQAYTDLCDMNAWGRFNNPPALFLYRDRAADPVGVAKWRSLRMAPFVDYLTATCINTAQSKKICRNPDIYLGVVFAGNERVGCGTTVCGPGPKGVYHACAAAPNWDYEDSNSGIAFIPGPRCSKCPAGYPFCSNGLCTTKKSSVIADVGNDNSTDSTDLDPPLEY